MVDRAARPVPYAALPSARDIPAVYAHGPDSTIHEGVPRGRVESFTWSASAVYPGTSRTVQVHVPPGPRDRAPLGLMVFQDGSLYLDEQSDMRAGVVLDNLIAAEAIPPVLAVFVDPGEPGNRNAEYDADDDRYASFLIDEILPEVRREHPFTDDPALSAICGGSSGGSCAFTAAWHRPDRFGLVLGFVSSFAQIAGGNPYPDLVRRTPPKPLRILLEAGSRDLGFDEPDGNWFSANLLVAAALAERGYDHRLLLGEGGHSPNHGGVVLPDALRWLWRQ